MPKHITKFDGDTTGRTEESEFFENLLVVLQMKVLANGLTEPPTNPARGERWIVGAPATGDWIGEDNNIAYLVGAGEADEWRFLTPAVGWKAYVEDEDAFVYWDGTEWKTIEETEGGGTSSVTIINDGESLPATGQDGDLLIDNRYRTPWGRFWNGSEWELFGAGSDYFRLELDGADWGEGDVDDGLEVDGSGNLTLSTS